MICGFNIQVWFWCFLTNVFILLLSLGFVFVCVCVCFIFVCVCLRVCFSSRGNTLFFSSVTLMGFPWWLTEAQSNKQEMLVVLSRD